MLDHEQLETFATVAEEQSFDKAAVRLNLTRSAVSQRVKALEESLSTVLLVRERPIAPTPTGEILLRYVKAMRLFESAALSELLPTPRPYLPVTLSIAVNADSLATWFPQVLRKVLLNPQTAIEVISEDQDHTAPRLARGEVIGCISTDDKTVLGFVAEPLGVMTYRCCATPNYAEVHFPDGLNLPGVLRATAVLFNRKDSLHDVFLQSVFQFPVERYAKHYLPSPAALLEAIVIGAGYGLVPGSQCEHLIRRGQLLDLAPQQAIDVELYWHHWDLEPPMARDITALIVEVARQQLKPSAGENVDIGNIGDLVLDLFQSDMPFELDADSRSTSDPADEGDALNMAQTNDRPKPDTREIRSASPNDTPDQANA